MGAAMDVVGNPSSVHGEGRAAKALIERARAQVAAALGAEGADIVFTSGATEAAAMACAGRGLHCSGVEHDAVAAWCVGDLITDSEGRVDVPDPARSALQLANSETGILQDLPEGLAVSDLTQAFGKVPLAFNWLGCQMGLVSAHKLGGPKGVGALILRRGVDFDPVLKGGGQEMGRRAGTENVPGAAALGAACQLVREDLSNLRDRLEKGILAKVPQTIVNGAGAPRVPNTTNIRFAGIEGEAMVIALDLRGFAVSSGAACSTARSRCPGR